LFVTQTPPPPLGRPPLVPPLLVPASRPGKPLLVPLLEPPPPPVRSRQQWVFGSHDESQGAIAWISDAFAISFEKSPAKEHAGTEPPDEPPLLLVVLPELDVVDPELDVVDPLLDVVLPLLVLPPEGFDGGGNV
jgi:hypothetical protein